MREPKRTIQPYTPVDGQQDDHRFIAVINDVSMLTQRHVLPVYAWYKSHANLPRIMFRAVGVVVIVLSISIPLLSVTEGIWKDVVLPIVALIIAGLTALTSFFQWQKAWEGRRQTQYAIEHLLVKWDLDMVAAKQELDPAKAIAAAIAATERLLDGTRLATSAETEQWFEGIRMPQQTGAPT